MTTPHQRIQRLIEEGATVMANLPDGAAVDITPDLMALAEPSTFGQISLKNRESSSRPNIFQGCPHPRPIPMKPAIGTSHKTDPPDVDSGHQANGPLLP